MENIRCGDQSKIDHAPITMGPRRTDAFRGANGCRSTKHGHAESCERTTSRNTFVSCFKKAKRGAALAAKQHKEKKQGVIDAEEHKYKKS